MQKALEDVVYIMNVYCTLYNITLEGEYAVSFDWDDSILVNKDEELNKLIMLMQNGLASKTELRMWYFGETKERAKQALSEIGEENKQAMEERVMNDLGG